MQSKKEMVGRAFKLALFAHGSKTELLYGRPMIEHVVRVASKFTDNDSIIVALLHDALEDSNITYQQLAQEDFSDEIDAGIEAITKRVGEVYFDYIARCRSNSLARQVKIADLEDRLGDRKRMPPVNLQERYRKALRVLRGA